MDAIVVCDTEKYLCQHVGIRSDEGDLTITTSLIDLKQRLRGPQAQRTSLPVEACEIAAAYWAQRDSAPRRLQGYLSPTRNGIPSSLKPSKRGEEHLAIGLWSRGQIPLPGGDALTLLDYQFPLKSVQADAGIGKVDLLGRNPDGVLSIVELKVARNLEDRRIALIEGLIYAAIVEANIHKISDEIRAARGIEITAARPNLLLVAPPDFWSDLRAIPLLEDFNALASAVAREIPIEISLLRLEDAKLVEYGLNSLAPVIRGHAFLADVSDRARTPTSKSKAGRVSYDEGLHRTFWNYRRFRFAEEAHLFEERSNDRSSPPVFQAQFAGSNLLTPPTGEPNSSAAIAAMIPPAERHRWFRSMKSSQALAQSVFGSLSLLQRLDALENILAEDGYPAFFASSSGYNLKLERLITSLAEPRPTSVDVFFDGPEKIAVEVKFSEDAFGRCSRPGLKPHENGYARYHCDGSFSVQRGRQHRCSLTEQGIPYWRYIQELFTWDPGVDHRPCPLDFSYQLVRNILAACVGQNGVLTIDERHVLVVYDDRNPAFQPGGEADAVWWATIHALRYPRLLRRVSWQRLAGHLGQFPDLAWLINGLREKYGIVGETPATCPRPDYAKSAT